MRKKWQDSSLFALQSVTSLIMLYRLQLPLCHQKVLVFGGLRSPLPQKECRQYGIHLNIELKNLHSFAFCGEVAGYCRCPTTPPSPRRLVEVFKTQMHTPNVVRQSVRYKLAPPVATGHVVSTTPQLWQCWVYPLYVIPKHFFFLSNNHGTSSPKCSQMPQRQFNYCTTQPHPF